MIRGGSSRWKLRSRRQLIDVENPKKGGGETKMIRFILLLATSVVTVRATSDMYDRAKKYINQHSAAWTEKVCETKVEGSC